jgi:DNA-binding response OmpR family regulator
LTDTFTVLIADRNPHIRKFLSRELETEGYRVLVAKDGNQLMVLLNVGKPPDLLILDLDLPHVDGLQVLEWLKDHDSPVPVVVHTYHTEHAGHPAVRDAAAFVEKTGNNIQGMKKILADVLRKRYPVRFGASHHSGSEHLRH